jgi:hypothetical protein
MSIHKLTHKDRTNAKNNLTQKRKNRHPETLWYACTYMHACTRAHMHTRLPWKNQRKTRLHLHAHQRTHHVDLSLHSNMLIKQVILRSYTQAPHSVQRRVFAWALEIGHFASMTNLIVLFSFMEKSGEILKTNYMSPETTIILACCHRASWLEILSRSLTPGCMCTTARWHNVLQGLLECGVWVKKLAHMPWHIILHATVGVGRPGEGERANINIAPAISLQEAKKKLPDQIQSHTPKSNQNRAKYCIMLCTNTVRMAIDSPRLTPWIKSARHACAPNLFLELCKRPPFYFPF